jgi:hypothetical protein
VSSALITIERVSFVAVEQERVALGQRAIGLSSTSKWAEFDAKLSLNPIQNIYFFN